MQGGDTISLAITLTEFVVNNLLQVCQTCSKLKITPLKLGLSVTVSDFEQHANQHMRITCLK